MPLYIPPEVEASPLSEHIPDFDLAPEESPTADVSSNPYCRGTAQGVALSIWIIIALCFGVYLLIAHIGSTDGDRGPVAIWSVLLVLPIVFFMLGPWLLGCRRELSQWRVLAAIVLSVGGGLISIGTLYIGVLVLMTFFVTLGGHLSATGMTIVSTIVFSGLYTYHDFCLFPEPL